MPLWWNIWNVSSDRLHAWFYTVGFSRSEGGECTYTSGRTKSKPGKISNKYNLWGVLSDPLSWIRQQLWSNKGERSLRSGRFNPSRDLYCGQRSAAHGTLFRALVWNSASARSPSQPQLLGTVSLTMPGARQHLTNLNSAWKPICLYSHSLLIV